MLLMKALAQLAGRRAGTRRREAAGRLMNDDAVVSSLSSVVVPSSLSSPRIGSMPAQHTRHLAVKSFSFRGGLRTMHVRYTTYHTWYDVPRYSNNNDNLLSLSRACSQLVVY
jgi:hypothetical protein